MESISIVPSTVLNSIYVNERKNCTGGSVVLDDRHTVYFMQVTDTTNISIDSSLLDIPTNCSLQFKLVVWSDKTNVLNFSGCSIEQIEIKRGESTFTMQWTGGSNVWSVIPDVLSGYNEVPLIAPSYPVSRCKGLAAADINKNIYGDNYGKKVFDIFSALEPYAINSNGFLYGSFANTPTFGAHVWSMKPFMIRKLQIHCAIWTNPLDSFPSSVSVYGSNDNVTWTPILSNAAITYESLTNTEVVVTGANNFYRMFKFEFTQTGSGQTNYPPISILGYEGNLLDNYYFKFLMPPITASSNGYNITANSSAMSSTSGSVYSLLVTNTDTYVMTRSDSSVNFEITCTLPTAQSICGIYLRGPYGDCFPSLLSIQGSNDGSDWTEIAKLDEDALYYGQSYIWRDYTYLFADTTPYSYYKIVTYMSDSVIYFNMGTLQLITKEKATKQAYETIVPALSSNSQDGYVVSVSSATDSTSAYMLFDGDDSDYCQGSYSDGEWILNIQLPQATVLKGVSIRAKSETNQFYKAPYAFTVQGSNDNDTWTVLDTENLGSSYWARSSQLGVFAFENSTAYEYYRLVCTASADTSTCGMAEVGLMTDPYLPNVNWSEDEYIVPVMSSDSQDGYVASATSSYDSSYAPYKAFTRNSSDCWVCSDSEQTDGNKECNVYLQIQLPTATAINVLNIVARSGLTDQSPSSFTLQASNNGSDWSTLLTVTDKDTYDSATWEVSNTTAYLYYKLAITKTNRAGSHVAVSEFNLINRIVHN